MGKNSWKSGLVLSCALAGGGWAAAAPEARNVILMVADGAGFNTWKATAMYEGTVGRDFHDGEGWVRLAASTHHLRRQAAPPVAPEHGATQFPSLVYDPAKAWDPTPVEGGAPPYPYHFAGYEWLRRTAPDSASTMSAMVTGRKTYSGGINVDGRSEPVAETVADLAHARGKLVGVVSSVPFTHATPAAAGGAHRPHRGAYCMLAVEMLTGDYPDLIAGCGNPDFDNNGRPIEPNRRKEYRYVGGKEVWELLTGAGELREGQRVCVPAEGDGADPMAGHGAAPADPPGVALDAEQIAALGRWRLRQTEAAIDSLTEGETPDRLLIVPQVGQTALWSGKRPETGDLDDVWIGGTLQQQRGSRANPRYTAPGHDPMLPGVPSLETLTRVALNALDDHPEGFFLHVEGGAVDWAMHANQAGRMVEEMIDFKRSVEAVIDWVEAHGGWGRTLLIVTADHDHMLWGPDADTVPFDPLREVAAGRLPEYRWLSNGHSNALVPVYARGVGAPMLASRAGGDDPFYGRYLDQTEIFQVIRAVLAPSPEP